jgi:hypothetical protein
MSPRSPLLAALVIALTLLAAPAAKADLGVEKASRSGGAPGERISLTIGCGACSAIGAEAPASFPISLVPVGKAPRPQRCGPNALCSPRVRAVPRRSPFTYLGEARLQDGEEGERPVLRYVLDFTIPKLPAGIYTYVIYCEACVEGKAASLITYPSAKGAWLVRVRR